MVNRATGVFIFSLVLVSYTLQTEAAGFIQTKKKWAQPYLLLWLTHIGYILVAPLHLFVLKLVGIDLPPLTEKLQAAFRDQFEDEASTPGEPKFLQSWTVRLGFSSWKLVRLCSCLAVVIATPALCWYIAVPFTSMTDITAIYNSNAFWAYVFSIYLTQTEHWAIHKAAAVSLACIGVIIIAYGDSSSVQETPTGTGSRLSLIHI